MTAIEADPSAKGIRPEKGIRPDQIEVASILFDRKVGIPGREVEILTNEAGEVQIRYSEFGLKPEDKKAL